MTEERNTLVSIVFTRLKGDAHRHLQTQGGNHRSVLCPLHNVLHWDNKKGFLVLFL